MLRLLEVPLYMIILLQGRAKRYRRASVGKVGVHLALPFTLSLCTVRAIRETDKTGKPPIPLNG